MTRSAVLEMNLSQFLAWEGDQPERYEFYRGKAFALGSGTARHNRTVLNLAKRIGDHLSGSRCQVFATRIKAQAAEGVFYPDVMVTCGKADAGDESTVNDPVLIVEVSSITDGYDKRDKFDIYRTLTSLREFVLIDPQRRRAESYTLSEHGRWLRSNRREGSALRLTSIDLTVPLVAVFDGLVTGQA